MAIDIVRLRDPLSPITPFHFAFISAFSLALMNSRFCHAITLFHIIIAIISLPFRFSPLFSYFAIIDYFITATTPLR
jgi:hypothetical protein